MQIGGLQKLTTLDYPGVVSAVVFTQGCNFACPYCHNPALLPASSDVSDAMLSRDEVFTFLRKRVGLLGGVVISGGEPTIQPGLLDFCLEVKKLKFKVKLDSNGGNPALLREIIRARAVDYLAMDLKAAPADYLRLIARPGALPAIEEKISASVALLQASGLPHEFRSTCVEPFIGRATLRELARLVRGSAWFLQEARLRAVLRPNFPMRPLGRAELEAALPLLREHAPAVGLRA